MAHPEAPSGAPNAVEARLLELLSQFHVLTLACRDAQGSWAAPVFFAHDGLDLFFMSSPASRHVRSLAFDPCQAGAIHGPADDWRSIVGLQLSGKVEPLAGAGAAMARAAYERRFPFVAGPGGQADAALAKALQKAGWYRLRIERAVLVDNTRGLGQRLQWDRPGA